MAVIQRVLQLYPQLGIDAQQHDDGGDRDGQEHQCKDNRAPSGSFFHVAPIQMEVGRIVGIVQQIHRLVLLEFIPGDDTGALQLVFNTVGPEAHNGIVDGDVMRVQGSSGAIAMPLLGKANDDTCRASALGFLPPAPDTAASQSFDQPEQAGKRKDPYRILSPYP